MHGAELREGPRPLPDLPQNFEHAIRDVSLFVVEEEGVLGCLFGEGDWGGGAYVVGIEGEADGIVDGEDLTLIELPPVLH